MKEKYLLHSTSQQKNLYSHYAHVYEIYSKIFKKWQNDEIFLFRMITTMQT